MEYTNLNNDYSKSKFQIAKLNLPCFSSPALFCPARDAAGLQGEVYLKKKEFTHLLGPKKSIEICKNMRTKKSAMRIG